MATKGELTILARLTACETLIQHILLMIAASKDDPVATLEDYRARVMDEYETVTFKGFDAATSDLLAQHLREALDDILTTLVSRAREG